MVDTPFEAARLLTVPMHPRELVDFHAGSAESLERCYREHFDDVRAAVGAVLRGADKDTVVHNVFFRIVSDPALRTKFRGGNLGAWLATVARNEAIDFRRRYAREQPLEEVAEGGASGEDALDAKILVERFRGGLLPDKLKPVFEARFLRQLSQREAARELGMQRTTLAYQEQRILQALRAFLLEEEDG
jgi:RNA polymerase sigma-70 factor, ECF subfamily